MPDMMPLFFLPLAGALLLWLLFTRGRCPGGASPSDRGLFLLLIFHTLNGAVFNTEFFLLLGFAIITLLEALIENRGRWTPPPIEVGLPLAVMLGFLAWSTADAMNPVKATQAAIHTGICAIAFLLISGRSRDVRFFKKLTGLIILSSLMVTIPAAVMLLRIEALLGFTAVLTTRLTIFYQHPNFLAPYFAFIALAGTAGLFWYRSRLVKALLALYIPVVLVALRLTDSRAGFLGFAAGLAVCALMVSTVRRLASRCLAPIRQAALRRRAPALIGLAAIVLALIAGAILFAEPVIETLRESTRIRRALDYRLDAWANSIEIIDRTQSEEGRLHGIGLDTFLSLKKFPPGSKFAHEEAAPHPHNLLLYIAQSSGIIALVAFLLLLAVYLGMTFRIVRKARDRDLRKLALLGLAPVTALVVCGLLDLGLSLVTLFPGPLWYVLGMLCPVYREIRGRSADRPLFTGFRAALPVLVLVPAAIFGAFLPATGRLLLKKGYLAEQLVTPDAGLRQVELALKADPLLTQAREFLLRRYIRRGKLYEAFELVEDAARLEPENPRFQHDLGDLHTRVGNREKAAEAYREAVRIDHGSPGLPGLYASLINAEAAAGQGEPARTHLEEAILRNIAVINLIDWQVTPHAAGRDDQFLEIEGMGELIRLEEVLDGLHERFRDSLARVGAAAQDRYFWFSLFQAYFNAHIHEQAGEVLDDIEAIWPEREKASIRFHRARIAEAMDSDEETRNLMAQAVAANDPTTQGTAIYLKTRNLESLIEEGRLDEAIDGLRRVLREKKDYRNYGDSFIAALDALIEALKRKGNLPALAGPLKARLFFCRSHAEKPPLQLALGISLTAAGRHDEAEKALAQALDLMALKRRRLEEAANRKIREPVRDLAFALADLYREMGLDGHGSLKRARTVVDLYSPEPVRYLYRHYFLLRCGLLQNARNALELALLENPHNVTLLEMLVENCLLMDDAKGLKAANLTVAQAFHTKTPSLDARCESLFGSLLEDSSNVELILELIRLLGYAHRFDHCMNVIREALALHPEEPRLHFTAARILRLDDRPEEALDALRKAVALDPGYRDAALALAHLERHLKGVKKGEPSGASQGFPVREEAVHDGP